MNICQAPRKRFSGFFLAARPWPVPQVAWRQAVPSREKNFPRGPEFRRIAPLGAGSTTVTRCCCQEMFATAALARPRGTEGDCPFRAAARRTGVRENGPASRPYSYGGRLTMPGGKRAWNEGRGPGPRQQMSRETESLGGQFATQGLVVITNHGGLRRIYLATAVPHRRR